MTQHEIQIMDRLAVYQPGGADAELLIQRLRQEHGWTRAAALAATEEYRRFLYLAVTCPHPVTPSPTVDAVWHEHLMFTREYREELCAGVLGRTLDHTPGGTDKADQHRQQYLSTLDAYRDVFGSAAPAGIWPDPRAAEQRSQTRQRTLLRALLCVAIAALALGMLFMLFQFFIQDVETTVTMLLISGMLALLAVFVTHGSPQRQNDSSGSSGGSSGGSCSAASCASSCGSGCGGGGCGS